MSNTSGIPPVPIPPRDDDPETAEPLPEVFSDGEEPLDPDIDPDQVDSAEADRRAATEGVKDGDLDD